MSTIVKNVSEETINKMKLFYQNYLCEKIPTGAIFIAKTLDTTITVYHSKKVMFQGKGSETEAQIWDGELTEKKLKHPKANHPFAPPDYISQLSIIGTDEAGTGDYFGPITVVAAYVAVEKLSELEKLGIRDSKTISDKKIIEIAKPLASLIPFSRLALKNDRYNQLQRNGMSQGKMKAWLHQKAINLLLKKIAPTVPSGILIDQFCEPNIYFAHTKTQPKENLPIYFSTQAESVSLSVAAASVIARYSFLQHLELLSNTLNMKIPKGAGSQVDEFAAQLIKKQGSKQLEHYAKIHFSNTQKAIKLLGGNP